jgi:hypothetical protein
MGPKIADNAIDVFFANASAAPEFLHRPRLPSELNCDLHTTSKPTQSRSGGMFSAGIARLCLDGVEMFLK